MYLLVVPIYAAVGWPNLDFMNYLTIWESLPIDAKRVGELVGVEERFLVRAMRGTINTHIPTQVSNHYLLKVVDRKRLNIFKHNMMCANENIFILFRLV